MLGKLIKHDFNSLSRVLLPTQIAVLGATILATIGFAINFRLDYSNNDGLVGLLRLITGFMSGIMVLAIIAASILVAFIIFQRFYKNLMCSEGYLTFTLPVTTSEILWSKLITAMLWTIISSVVIFISLNIFVLFGTGQDTFVNTEAYRQMGKFFHEAFSTIGGRLVWPILEVTLFVIVSTVSSILHVYLALIIGGIVSQKHKILASIGFYFVINIAVSILSTILSYCLGTSMVVTAESFDGIPWNTQDALSVYNVVFGAMQPYYWTYLVFSVAICAAFFILSHYFLKNKLNLE
ncbi:MAG: hypothetical protein CVU91_03830 [Firmicutes bacterium HGW-Firmicutes-16]|nr:MAG: hypothetical protein CVU91_03830 [Firmicutes bacterium HGW-Firmicutes-16]